jgi:hypothetical protein
MIEVPLVEVMPESAPQKHPIADTAAYLLTALLRHDSGTLYSNYQSDAGRWHVRGRDASPPDEVLVNIEPRGIFRALLAHFGAHYMGGQVYGGYSERRLSQRGRTHGIAIYMANDQWRGFWLKAYSSTAIYRAPGDGEAGPA